MKLKLLTRKDVQGLADSRRVFDSGEEYLRAGAVYEFSASPEGITARVHGNYGEYSVRITPDLEMRCNCPYEGDVCKHLIAVLLRFLEGDSSPGEAAPSARPDALEQTLTDMAPDALKELILRLARENASVRRALLENVTLPPVLLRQQPNDPKRVKALNKAVDRAVEQAQAGNFDAYGPPDEGVTVDVSDVLESALMLHPDDQTEVYWHIVAQVNERLEDYGLNPESAENALVCYAQTVAEQELSHQDKRYYFDTVLSALNLPMCDYGDGTGAIKEALDAMATTPEDYHYLIQALAKRGKDSAEIHDWVIGYYRFLGDEARYLEERQDNLHTEAQHLELADFWRDKGDTAQEVATLESWVRRRDEEAQDARWFYYPSVGGGSVLQRLDAHYTEIGDDANLCRIVMTQARQTGVTLALYQRVEAIAKELGTWSERRAELLKQSQGVERARIYLHEQDWERAIAYARLSSTHYDRTREVVAEAVQEHFPEQAIELYEALVQECINQAKRDGYRKAAGYAARIKAIYTDVLKDNEAAAQYLADIRQANARRSALQDEFRDL